MSSTTATKEALFRGKSKVILKLQNSILQNTELHSGNTVVMQSYTVATQ